MDPVKSYKEVDTDKAWAKVRYRLEEDGLLPEQGAVVRVSLIPRRLAVAATILVLFAIGSLSYFIIPGIWSPKMLTLQTGSDNSTYVQTLNDGSIVYLGDNSVLKYPAIFKGAQRKISLSGEAFFDIAPDSASPFIIETENAIVEVLGTAFNIRSGENDFEVIVEEGSVRVSLRSLPDLSAEVGRWEMIYGSDSSLEKLPVVDRTYLSWRMNRMQFRDERLGNIISVISKNYDVNIGFYDDAIADRRLNVTFDDNNIGTIIEVIALGLGLDYEILPDSRIMFGDRN